MQLLITASIAFALGIASPTIATALSSPFDTTMRGDQGLAAGGNFYSGNRAYELRMQNDGNLVLYYGGGGQDGQGVPLWASSTQGHPGAHLSMQVDGNLVVYDIGGLALWDSHTQAYAGAYLSPQNDGNMVIYDAGGTARWNTATYTSQTPANGGGDCWRIGTPTGCRTNWTWASRNAIYFRAIDQYSTGAPEWDAGIRAAVSAWSSAPGPQVYSFAAQPNDTWIYIQDNSTGQWDLIDTAYGIAWNCPVGGPCNDTGNAFNVAWSEIHLNHVKLDGRANVDIQNAAGHESGHALLLAHNTRDTTSIMWQYHNPPVGGPNSNDIGTFPGCASLGIGLRCIYGSGN